MKSTSGGCLTTAIAAVLLLLLAGGGLLFLVSRGAKFIAELPEPTAEQNARAETIAMVRRTMFPDRDFWHKPVFSDDEFLMGPLKGGMAVLVADLAAYWIKNGHLFAANGHAKSWSPEINYAPVGIRFDDVEKAARSFEADRIPQGG